MFIGMLPFFLPPTRGCFFQKKNRKKESKQRMVGG